MQVQRLSHPSRLAPKGHKIRRRGGNFYERVIEGISSAFAVMIVVGGIGYQSGLIPRLWHHLVGRADRPWAWVAILFLLEVVCLFFTVSVMWLSPQRQLVPQNQLTLRVKQGVKISITVTMFGLSAFWGAVAGDMMSALRADKNFRRDTVMRVLYEVAGTPVQILLSIAWLAVIAIVCADLKGLGRNGRVRALRQLRRNLYRQPSDIQLRDRARYGAPYLARWVRSRRMFVPIGLLFTKPIVFALLTYMSVAGTMYLVTGL